tara:strand:- start:963 stop:1673 length:711 start_codon:yes stop_codon:yes gene_type:complete
VYKSLPKHVAIIMDGNGRWAQSNGFINRWDGHKYGVNAVRSVIRSAIENKIGTLTLFAFSKENQSRSQKEVDFLIHLLEETLLQEVDELVKNEVELRFCGDLQELSSRLNKVANDVELRTKNGSKLRLNLAINYSGQWQIQEAFKTMLDRVGSFTDSASEMNQIMIAPFGSEPDLLIRTSGEFRLSNFMLYQLAYTELYFSDVLWPDFSKKDFEAALKSYQKRERRYGQTKNLKFA